MSEQVNDLERTVWKIVGVMFLLTGVILGYFLPHNHYEIRGERLCAVSWTGSAACVAYEADWIPQVPQRQP